MSSSICSRRRRASSGAPLHHQMGTGLKAAGGFEKSAASDTDGREMKGAGTRYGIRFTPLVYTKAPLRNSKSRYAAAPSCFDAV